MLKNKWLFFDCFGVVVCEASEIWMKNHQLDSSTCDIIRNKIFPLNDVGAITHKEQMHMLEDVSGINENSIQEEWIEIEEKNQGLIDLIKKLRTSYNVALLSNASSENLSLTLKRLGIDNLFDRIFVSSELKMRKPDSEIFLKILEICSCRPEDAMMIDDRQSNVDGAKAVGMNGILFIGVDDLKSKLKLF